MSENKNIITGQTFARCKVAVASVVYIVMIFIVIFGMSDGVYNGFPRVVPYIIITIFLMMAFVRMYQFLIGDIPEKSKKGKKKAKKAEAEAAETETDSASETETGSESEEQ